jgi:phage gp29-like protein
VAKTKKENECLKAEIESKIRKNEELLKEIEEKDSQLKKTQLANSRMALKLMEYHK